MRRQGIDVVDLGAGEPDFPTPEHVKAAAHPALDQNFTKYTPSAGITELRQAVCQRYQLDYGVGFKPEEVIVTAGGKQALYNTALVLFDHGDEVITHAPVLADHSRADQAGRRRARRRPDLAGRRVRDPRGRDAGGDHAANQGDPASTRRATRRAP